MALQKPTLDLDWLERIHTGKRLHLATGRGLQGTVHLNGDREALVSELIRLARIGQRAELEALADERTPVGAILQ